MLLGHFLGISSCSDSGHCWTLYHPISYTGSFCSDDVAHLWAWILMIAYAAVTQATFSGAERILSVGSPPRTQYLPSESTRKP